MVDAGTPGKAADPSPQRANDLAHEPVGPSANVDHLDTLRIVRLDLPATNRHLDAAAAQCLGRLPGDDIERGASLLGQATPPGAEKPVAAAGCGRWLRHDARNVRASRPRSIQGASHIGHAARPRHVAISHVATVARLGSLRIVLSVAYGRPGRSLQGERRCSASRIGPVPACGPAFRALRGAPGPAEA
jgi:hypothetical protein